MQYYCTLKKTEIQQEFNVAQKLGQERSHSTPKSIEGSIADGQISGKIQEKIKKHEKKRGRLKHLTVVRFTHGEPRNKAIAGSDQQSHESIVHNHICSHEHLA